MKNYLHHPVMLLLAVFLGGFLAVSEVSANDHKKLGPMEVRTLLEKGQAAGALPEGMIIRVSACLGERKEEAAANGIPPGLTETWEFTSKQVRRIRLDDVEEESENRTREQVDKVPFDSKNLCKELLEGKAIEIQSGQGTGPEVGFVGSSYERGSRSIKIEFQGETVLELFETNGPFLQLYRETDARAFGALYEKLAGQARNHFQKPVVR